MQAFRSFVSSLLLFALVFVALSLREPARAAEIDPALVAAAKKEGRVVLYTPMIVDQIVRPLAAAFRAKYGIDVQYLRMDSAAVVLKILNEYRARRADADVFSTSLGIESLIASKAIRKFDSVSAAELPAPGHDVDLSDAPLVRFEPAAPRQGRAAVAAEPVRSHTSGSDLDLSVGIADDYAIRALQMQVLDAAQSARPGLHAGPQNDSSNAVQTSDEENSTGLTLVEAAQITGVALTAGTVWWALRAGGLLAGLLVSLPAWRHADLLAVLPDDEEDDNWDLAEDDEAARDEQAVAQVFEPAFEGDLR